MECKVPSTSTSFLAGRVRREALPPVLPGSPSPTALKRLMLPQGELAQLLDGARPMRFIAVVELRPGALRGNHFHKRKEEYIYLIAGRAILWVQDLETSRQERIPLVPGDLAFVPTGIAHALEVLEAGHAVEFSETPFVPEDTYRYVLKGEAR